MDLKEVEEIIDSKDPLKIRMVLREIDNLHAAQGRTQEKDERLEALVQLVTTAINGDRSLHDVASILRRKLPHPPLVDNIRAVAVLAHRDRLERRSGGWRLITKTLGGLKKLCSGEANFNYPVTFPATAFLVREDLLVTLRHNVSLFSGLDEIRAIFDFELLKENKPETTKLDFSEEEVFTVTGQSSLVGDDSVDAFVVLQLSRPVRGRIPVVCNFGAPIEAGKPVYMIGHPCGLPKIHADDAKVLDASSPRGFTADLDAFAGNSGSPVFNGYTHFVEGVLIRGGHQDYEKGNGGLCYKVKVHHHPNLFPYKIRRIQPLQRLLES